MAGDSEDITVRLRLAADRFQREMDEALKGLPPRAEAAGEQAGERFAAGINKKAAMIGAALGAGAVIVQQAVSRSMDLAAELDASSQQLGVGVERLQEWRYAAGQAGVSAGELDGNVQKLTMRIGEAAGGSRDAQQRFVDLGVGFETLDGRARATEEVFADVIQRLSEIEDPAERARLGARVLGEQYLALEPLVRGGAEGLRLYAEELRAANGALTQEDIARLRDANAAWDQAKQILSVNIAAVTADNADAIIALANAFGTAAGAIGDALNRYREWRVEIEQGRERLQVRNLDRRAAGDNTLFGIRVESEADMAASQRSYSTREFDRQLRMALSRDPASAAPPRVTGGTSSGSGRRGTSARSGPSQEELDAERERLAAIREAERAEQDFAEAITRTIRLQQDSARVEEVRKEMGDAAAAAEEARLAFQRQHPLAVHQTVEALVAALGVTRELTDAEREHYQSLIASADAAEDVAAATARRAVEQRKALDDKRDEARAAEKDQAEIKRAIDEQRRLAEDAVRDVADIYEDLFHGNTRAIWRDFKNQGLRVLAEIAAQWTLALISGQSGRGPVAGGPGGLLGGILGGVLGGGGLVGADGGPVAGGSTGGLFGSPGAGAALGPASMAVAALPLAFSLGSAAFGLLGGKKKGIASLSATEILSSRGKYESAALGAGGEVLDTISRIADALGASVSGGAVSISQRGKNWRVDPTGGGATKTGKGAIDFGSDQQAAIEFAVRDLIADGVLSGISAASQRILASGQDLEAAINKAVQIESLPKLLRARIDPLGAALEAVDDKFRRLAETLREGGASAEQVAQARQLWQLEREDTLRQIGQASQQLKDFLLSLRAGPQSPLSLRQQQAEAEAALAPFVEKIEAARAATAELERLRASGAGADQIKAAEDVARAAAAAIDQAGARDAAQLVLGISRQINASGSGFFADFDRITGLVGGAVGAIDGAVGAPGAARDPFTELTAQRAGDISNQLLDLTRVVQQIAAGVNGGQVANDNMGWITQGRSFI